VERIGMSTFKPKSTGREGFEAIRQRVADAQKYAEPDVALALKQANPSACLLVFPVEPVGNTVSGRCRARPV
jgi:hypothetical protein